MYIREATRPLPPLLLQRFHTQNRYWLFRKPASKQGTSQLIGNC
ncbi:hypothetical protein MASSI9I_90112 [Massilia sp. 9I]|nr:hypothetical protein MASSI9I_90112 [Massilia sp. 9I]